MKKSSIMKSTCAIIVVIVVLSCCGAGYQQLLVGYQKEEIKTTLNEYTQKNAILVKNKVETTMSVLKGVSIALGQYSSLLKLEDRARINSFLFQELGNLEFKRLRVIPKGELSFGVDQQAGVLPEEEYSNTEYYSKAIMGDDFVFDPVKDLYDSSMVIIYSTPIYSISENEENEIIGVLCGVQPVQCIENLIDVSMFSGKGYAHILSSKGFMLMRSNYLNMDEGKELNIFMDEYVEGFALETMKESMKNEVEKGFVTFKHPNQAEKFSTYIRVGIKDWYVTSVVPISVLNDKVKMISTLSIALIAAAISLISLLLLIIWFFQMKSKQHIYNLAYFDPLTQVSNKNKFLSDMEKMKHIYSGEYAVAIFNIKNFKNYNGLFGYEKGDDFIKLIHSVLKDMLEADEFYARDTAERFCYLFHYESTEKLYDRIFKAMNKLESSLSKETKNYPMVMHCGLYFITPEDTDKLPNQFLDFGMTALSSMKNDYGHSIAVYDVQMNRQQTKRNQIENTMRQSLKDKEFLLYLQPKVNTETEKIAGAEALVRWDSTEYGMIYPNDFIPLFEENGFVKEVDMYMLEAVCQKLREWLDAGIDCIPIAVNQSRLHFYDGDYLERVVGIVDKYNIPHQLIELELTESVFAKDKNILIKTAATFREKGFHISIDDFGSGYSSLNMLKDFEVDTVKLDKDFFHSSSNTKKGVEIISSILELIGKLGYASVAEGVETIEQVNFLKKHKCDLIQGYYYERPISVIEFEKKYVSHMME